jgi:hypothetical protein
MRTTGTVLLLVLFSINISAQKNVPVIIKLKDGETLEVYHFGQLNCSSTEYFESYIMLKGKYVDHHTEIKDYRDINKLVLIGFKDDPVSSIGNQKGEITVYKKNGVSVSLKEAELYMSCYGSIEKYNQIRVQMINPLTEKLFEKAISTNNIESITFK